MKGKDIEVIDCKIVCQDFVSFLFIHVLTDMKVYKIMAAYWRQ